MPTSSSLIGFNFDSPDDRWLARVRQAVAPLDGLSRTDTTSPACDHVSGDRLGSYELVRRIGAGGMGSVWLARRADDQFEHSVAIKVIKRGMDTDEVVRRFRLERQVLATLVHPHIARLYDGGATDDGRPFLVMEYVDGVPILEHCDVNHLDVDQRLRLFLLVCHAVQQAHSSLVLHRDLKPSNVLVTRDGSPKLLDFGIAKLLHDDAAGTLMTVTTARALTPRYASPEQVRGDRLTTATDVYSLGVVLFELLAGGLPYQLESGARSELERAVLEQEPRALSQAVQRRDDLDNVDRKRLAQRLRGDLNVITDIALQKDPARRYLSVEQFSEDVRRHLEGLPLLVRRPGLVARSLRMVRRRRGVLFAASLGGVLSLMIGTLFVIYWFLAPSWFDEHVWAAHRSFMNRRSNHAAYNVIFWNRADYRTQDMRRRTWVKGLAPVAYEDALAEYDAALRLSPGNKIIRLERTTFDIAAALAEESDRVLVLTASLVEEIPLTCSYAETTHLDKVIPKFNDSRLQSAGAVDLRCLGLLAMLSGNLETTLDTWPRLQLEHADPLIEASLGNIYLALDEPELAYPRLLSAHRAYPQTGTLTVYLADAAVRCGDVQQARLLLDRAVDQNIRDNGFPFERVEMLCLLAEGDIESAFEVYDQANLELTNPIAVVQLAAHFERNGDDLAALRVLAGRLRTHCSEHATPAKFIRLLEAWWSRLSKQEQAGLVRDGADSDLENGESLVSLLRLYTASIESMNQFAVPHPLALRARWTQLAKPVEEDRLATSRTNLLELAARFNETGGESRLNSDD